jgi:hypothetical protein
MQTLVVQPTQWAQVPDMVDIDPRLDATDTACLAALREVLQAHGKLQRFGISLVHRHFPLDDDECLIETIDVQRRMLTVMPVRRTALPAAVPTQWNLASRDPLQWCEAWCHYSNGDHRHGHQVHVGLDADPL